MDYKPVNSGEVVIYIERCVCMMKQVSVSEHDTCDAHKKVDEVNRQPLVGNGNGNSNSMEKGKCSSMSQSQSQSQCHNSSKKPPRPPGGLSLYLADEKLMKEISELAKLKRARRRKKNKAEKTSSASTSSTLNWIATLFTILFCVLIIFQGCYPTPWNTSGGGAKDSRKVMLLPI